MPGLSACPVWIRRLACLGAFCLIPAQLAWAQFGGPNGMSDEEAATLIGILLIFGLVGLVIGLTIMAFICWLLGNLVQAIPEEHREISPGQVWLLLIPCFNLVWNFMVYQRISRSYENYFESQGRTEFGDCNAQLGLWYAICVCCSVIPLINYLAGPASLVLMIMYLVKMYDLKKHVAVVAYE